MASLTATQPLTLDSLPLVDLTTLTQSELLSLSLCSPTAFDLHRSDNIIIPSIDRSSFNESAGSRRQTFSRPSPNNHHSSHHHPLRHRLPGLLLSPKPPPPFPPLHDPEALENRSIISSLKVSLKSHPEFHHLDFTSPPSSPRDAMVSYGMRDTMVNFEIEDAMISLGKRKRGWKPNVQSGNSGEEREKGLEIVNKNGVAVDMAALGGLEDPYGEELKRRTEGMSGNEEALLGFMRDLGGQWCSRRRKRRIVDASIFGGVLPIGWKLLLGLKRREGRASVYCRRYISPGGRQFVSCKEVSAYLQSYFELHDAPLTMDKGGDIAQHAHQMASENEIAIHKDDDQRRSAEREKEVNLLGMDNLAEVQIHDLFECHKCNMTFDEKDAYLQHLLSFHQRTTRRYRLGSSVGDGVILRDGKFECQFCHKVFHERRRYNGHVGIHVRNFVRGIEDSPGLLTVPRRTEVPTKQELPVRISKMDALIEIAQNSILETTAAVPRYELNDGSSPDKLNAVSNPEIPASTSDHEMNSDLPLSESGTEDETTNRTMNQDLCQQTGEPMVIDEKIKKIDEASNVVNVDALFDAKISASLDEQSGTISETLVQSVSLTFHADELEKSCIEQRRGSQSNLLVLSTDLGVCDVENNVNSVGAGSKEHPKPGEVDNNKNAELLTGLENSCGPAKDVAPETIRQTSEQNVLLGEVSESSMSQLQPLKGASALNAISNKGEDGLCSIDQRHDNVTRIDELRLDDIEPIKFSFGGVKVSPSLPEVPMDLGNNPDIGGAYSSSNQFESEILLNMAGKHQLATVCVWCGTEFNQEAVDSEIQSDSVGYMCPTCKAKFLGNSLH
ncbi:uncharacterized protein LOC111309095 isoform X2 [Durio zibethinus]|uniref:Uncharacterized protein LOC111309095 isoform X2 n=1 Tax=Durio zibethinus TaxID=66656 RepID=A0A6P6AFN3_DURZI|nr:uncharacterized protein LOC111309095 isoform X2 [Durio zibethinus]